MFKTPDPFSAGCEAGKRETFMKLLAARLGAKVSANTGNVAGTGTGQWRITDRDGSTVEDDTRSGSVPLIGRTLWGDKKSDKK